MFATKNKASIWDTLYNPVFLWQTLIKSNPRHNMPPQQLDKKLSPYKYWSSTQQLFGGNIIFKSDQSISSTLHLP